jgi:CheY-like chemotaxis protein
MEPSATSSPSALRGLPVLIVDDDPLSGKLLATILRGEGCDVQIVPSAEQGLAVIAGFRARLILIDLVLPLMGGLWLIERINSDPRTRGIVMIGMSAFNGPETGWRALEAGCAAFVQKPIDADALIELIASQPGLR